MATLEEQLKKRQQMLGEVPASDSTTPKPGLGDRLAQTDELEKKKQQQRALLESLGAAPTEQQKKRLIDLMVPELVEARQKAEEERSSSRSRARWGEFADQLARSLTQYAAARKGVAIDAGTADWSDVRKDIEDRYQGTMEDVSTREKQAIEALEQKPETASSNRLTMAKGVMTPDGMPVYQKPGVKGYVDANENPIAKVVPYEPKKADNYIITLQPDNNLITEEGAPVYRKIIRNKADPQDTKIIVTDETGEPLDVSYGPKTGLDPKSLLKDKEIENITNSENALEMLDLIEEQKQNIVTGRYESVRNSLASFVNLDDPSVSSFRSNVSSTLNKYIKQMTGAQMSEAEAKRLLQDMPRMEDKDATFLAKLAEVRKRLMMYDKRYKDKLRSQGRRFEQFEAQAKKSTKTNTVNLKYKKDGKIYPVPQDKADAALKTGDWERVE